MYPTAERLLGCAATLLVSADLRDTWRRLDGLDKLLDTNAPTAGSRAIGEGAGSLVPTRLVVATVLGVVAGLVLVIAGWAIASSAYGTGPAFGGLATAIAGILMAVAAGGGFLASLQRRLQAGKARLARLRSDSVTAVLTPVGRRPGSVVVADGLTRYHRSGCPAITGLAVQDLSLDRVPAGLVPCGLCRED
jgi:hypothetical protein